jgi:hypothetical protein
LRSRGYGRIPPSLAASFWGDARQGAGKRWGRAMSHGGVCARIHSEVVGLFLIKDWVGILGLILAIPLSIAATLLAPMVQRQIFKLRLRWARTSLRRAKRLLEDVSQKLDLIESYERDSEETRAQSLRFLGTFIVESLLFLIYSVYFAIFLTSWFPSLLQLSKSTTEFVCGGMTWLLLMSGFGVMRSLIPLQFLLKYTSRRARIEQAELLEKESQRVKEVFRRLELSTAQLGLAMDRSFPESETPTKPPS